jgi:hypothetical protein
MQWSLDMPQLKRVTRLRDASAPRQKLRGNRVQLAVTVVPELANRLDEAAHREGMSRSALLTMIINEWLRRRGDA